MKSSKETVEEQESKILVEIERVHTLNVMATRGEAVIKAEIATVINVQHLEGIVNAAVSEEAKREAINNQLTLWANSQPTEAESHLFTVINNTQNLPTKERVEVIKNAINRPAASLPSPQEKGSLAQFVPVALPENANFQAQQSSGEGIHLQAGNAGKIKVKKVTKHININLPQSPSPALKDTSLEKKRAELDSLVYFKELTLEGEITVAKHETVVSRDLSIEDILKYEAGSADIDYSNDKRRKRKNVPERQLVTADKAHVKTEGRMDVRRSVLKDGGGNPSQQRASSTVFFNSESIIYHCANGQHIVEIKYNLLKLAEDQRRNLQAILRGRDGLEAFEWMPGSIQERRNCITQLAFGSAYSAKNLIIALKQSLASYQKVSFSSKERFPDAPWLEAITYEEEAGEYVVNINYPPLRLTQAERTRLQTPLQKIEKDDFDCEPEKTVTSRNCIQQLVFVSEESAQACIAELHAAMENGLQEDEILQEEDEGRKQASSPKQGGPAANPFLASPEKESASAKQGLSGGAEEASGRRKQTTAKVPSLITVQEARIVSSSQTDQERWEQGGLSNPIHPGSVQIGSLQTRSFKVIGEQYTYYKPNKEDEERGNLILNQPELFYNPKPWGMFPKANPHFVGREEKLDELKKSFDQASHHGAAAIINQRRLHRQQAANGEVQTQTYKSAQGVLGLGGVGKTQLAAEYVYTLMDADEDKPANTIPLERQYALIVWLRGESLLFEQDLLGLAVWVGLIFEPNTPMKQIAQALYMRLAKLSNVEKGPLPRPRVLWIVDDAYWEDSLQELLPQPQQAYQGCFHWLITSREQSQWKKYFGDTFKPCVLGVFSEEEAQLYLDKVLKPEVKQQANYIEDCQWLMQQMGYLPLALAQAVAYINQLQADNSLAKYCGLFQIHGDYLSGIGIEKGDERAVLTTWLITLSVLLNEENLTQGQSALAIRLLLVSAYCDGNRIPLGLLQASQGDSKNLDERLSLKINEAVQCLANYSLITPLEGGAIQVHQLVQQVLCWWMEGLLAKDTDSSLTKKQGLQLDQLEHQMQQAEIEKENILLALAENIIDHADELAPLAIEEFERQKALVNHLKKIIAHLEKKDLVQVKEKSTLMNLYWQLGIIQKIQGNASVALIALEHALPLAQLLFGENALEVGNILADIGNAYGRISDPIKKKARLEQSLSIFRMHQDKNSFGYAITLADLANVYGVLGDLMRKKELLEESLSIQKKINSTPSISEIITRINLGNAYGALGNALRQKEILEECIKLQKEVISDSEHIDFFITHNSLGTAYLALNNAALAVEQFNHAVVIGERYYGPNHIEIAQICMNLGNAHVALGNVLESRRLLERALHIYKEKHGKDIPFYIHGKLLISLGILYLKEGDLLKSKKLFTIALGVQYEETIALAHLNLSSVEFRLNQPSIALEHANNALKIFKERLGLDDKARYVESARRLVRACENKLRSTLNSASVTYTQEAGNTEPLSAFSLESNKAGQAVWYQLVPGERQDFHYVYLHWPCQTQLQNIIEGEYGLQAASCYQETFAEGNERLPMQIGFKTKEAALALLNELDKAIIANTKRAGLLRI